MRGFTVALLLPGLPAAAAAESYIGVYGDVTGNTCTLSDNAQGPFNVYVVVHPGQQGVSAARFSAPPPACFTGTYIGDEGVAGTLAIGNSQTGITVALTTCSGSSTHILTMQYFGHGTTPACCAYDVSPDPGGGVLEVVDCFFATETPLVSRAQFNSDGSCGCGAAPRAPQYTLPPDGATEVPVNVSLEWQASTDIDGDIPVYDVYLGTDPDPPLAAAGQSSTSYPVAGLVFATTHYWRIVARDLVHQTSGPVWSFVTRLANYPPAPPTLVSPPDGSQDWTRTPELTWQGSDPDGDSLTYAVHLGTETSPPLIADSLLTTSFSPPELAYSTQYHWRIVASDPHGGEASSPPWTFSTIVNAPPGTPSDPFPTNGDTMWLPLVTLRWKCTDPEGHALVFDVYLGTESPLPLIAAGVATKTYSPDTLSLGTEYHWRILARDEFGGETSGPEWTFTTVLATGVTPRSYSLALGQNHPNPFNPTTVIPYTLPNGSTPARVRLLILDVSGRVVRTLVDEDQPGGPHEVIWDGRDDRGGPVSSGVYFSVLDADGDRRTRKLVLLK